MAYDESLVIFLVLNSLSWFIHSSDYEILMNRGYCYPWEFTSAPPPHLLEHQNTGSKTRNTQKILQEAAPYD